MKKLYLTFASLVCCWMLALPVSADVAPIESPMSNTLLLGALVLVAGFCLYWILRKFK
ncbi:MAG: hypothetical protein J5878_02120 [Oscillospiraceae bacterium]|nr:hypothetical protein [Oscillospiraceae bacterium]